MQSTLEHLSSEDTHALEVLKEVFPNLENELRMQQTTPPVKVGEKRW